MMESPTADEGHDAFESASINTLPTPKLKAILSKLQARMKNRKEKMQPGDWDVSDKIEKELESRAETEKPKSGRELLSEAFEEMATEA